MILGAIVLVWISQTGMIWSIHKDVAGLRERMAKLEGALDGFIAGFKAREAE